MFFCLSLCYYCVDFVVFRLLVSLLILSFLCYYHVVCFVVTFTVNVIAIDDLIVFTIMMIDYYCSGN